MPQDSDRESKQLLSPEAALSRFSPADLPRPDSPAQAGQQVRYGFRVGDMGFLIARMTLSEVMLPPAVYRLPNTQRWFLGIANLRGNLIPIFDLAPLLGHDAPRATETRTTLILDAGEKAVAIMIDGYPKMVSISGPLQSLPPLPGVIERYVDAGCAADGDIWLDLNHVGLFDSLGQQASMTRFNA